jgi:rhodanese-related sulfurtransferase
MSLLRFPFAAILVAFTLLAIHACSQDSGPHLGAQDAYALSQAGQLTLIDIRRPDEWKKTGVAQGALRINMAHPLGDEGFIRQVSAEVGGDREAPIGLLCRAGNRAVHVQRMLHDAGFTQVYNVKEGMTGSSAGPGWIARGLPVER